MKYNKKKCMAARCLRGMLALTVLSAMLGLAACRTETGDMDNTEASGNNHTAGSVSQEDSRPPDSAADQTAADVPKRPLTQEELRGFEEYLNRLTTMDFFCLITGVRNILTWMKCFLQAPAWNSPSLQRMNGICIWKPLDSQSSIRTW